MNKQEAIQEGYKGNYEGLHRRIKMNRDNFIYAAIITGSLDLIRDLPEGDEIDMCEGMERMAEGFRNEGRSEGKLEEKRSTLKEQLEIKLGTISNNLELQLTNATLENVGEDPNTKLPDTLLFKSFVPKKGNTVIRDTFKQQRDSYDFVVRVEDFRGNMVKERVWKDIVPLAIEQLPVSLNNLSDPEELSQEDPTAKLGKQYLLDGDKKGDQSFGIESWTSFYTYLAGPMAVSTPEKPGKALFIIDMMEEKLPAEVRLYGMLAVRTSWPYGPGQYETFPKWGDVWTMCYASKLPSSVTLYASQTKDDDASWVEISHFEQDRRIDNKERWCERCNENGDYLIVSRDALDLASPCFITLTCPAEGEKYRYLKVVVNEVFFAPIGFENAFMGGNDQKYVTVHELEVYTAKD